MSQKKPHKHDLKKGIIFSAIGHVVIFLVGLVGVPLFLFWQPENLSVIPIEIQTVAEETNIASLAKKLTDAATEAPTTNKVIEKDIKHQKIQKGSVAPPQPAQKEAASKQGRNIPQQEKIKLSQKAPPMPSKPIIKPRPEGKKNAEKAKHILPKKKKQPKSQEQDFSSVLKNLQQSGQKPNAKRKGETDFHSKNSPKPEQPLTISEMDAVRRQIAACWHILSGAQGAEDLLIFIYLKLNQDGTVAHAEVLDKSPSKGNPHYQSAAQSALRAVRDPRCMPLKLPAEKYESWKELELIFNPKEML